MGGEAAPGRARRAYLQKQAGKWISRWAGQAILKCIA